MARLGEFLEASPDAIVTTATLRGGQGKGQSSSSTASTGGSAASQTSSSSSSSSDGGGGSSKSNGNGKKLLEGTKPLSKFELECRAKAQERQKQVLALGTPQVAAGMVFGAGGRGSKSAAVASEAAALGIPFTSPPAFVPKPAVVNLIPNPNSVSGSVCTVSTVKISVSIIMLSLQCRPLWVYYYCALLLWLCHAALLLN